MSDEKYDQRLFRSGLSKIGVGFESAKPFPILPACQAGAPVPYRRATLATEWLHRTSQLTIDKVVAAPVAQVGAVVGQADADLMLCVSRPSRYFEQ